MAFEKKLKGGVILIGSLYWQDDLKKNDNIRKEWRDTSLDIEKSILAKLPIRYGRYSNNDIYTMVFSTNCIKNKTLGLGYIVPFFKNPLNDIEDIFKEAIRLSKSEGMNGKFAGGSTKKWGTLAILFNKNKINSELKISILEKWKQKIKTEGDGNNFKEYCFGKEKPSIFQSGELCINWPVPLDAKYIPNINELDFLIATVTKPKHKSEMRYPSISEIADLVNKDSTRKYFINNISNKIMTFQDIRILNKINGELNDEN